MTLHRASAERTFADLLSARSRQDVAALDARLRARYRADGFSAGQVPDHVHQSLLFNLLLLAPLALDLRYQNQDYRVVRSFVLSSRDPLPPVKGVPVLLHQAVAGEQLIYLACIGLYSVPLALIDGARRQVELLAFPRTAEQNRRIEQIDDAFFDWLPQLAVAAGEARRTLLHQGPPNYIHYLTNILPGTVLAAELMSNFELVVSTRYFGPPEHYLDGSKPLAVRAVGSKALAAYSRQQPVLLARPVGSYVPQSLLERVIRREASAEDPRPTVIIAVRTGNRSCANEVEFVSAVIAGISAQRACRFVILGWLWPDQVDAAYQAQHLPAALEADARVREIQRRCEHLAYLRAVSLWELGDGIAAMRDACFYLSPCGSINHLITWISGAPGVIHGPQNAVNIARGWNHRAPGHHHPHELDARYIHPESDHPRSNYRIELDAAAVVVEQALARLPAMRQTRD